MRTTPFLAAAVLFAAVAACDRGPADTRNDPSTYTKNGPQAGEAATPAQRAPNARTGADATQAPRQTLATNAAPRDTLNDTVITGKIKTAILTDPGMTGADVSVHTDKGAVTLTGTVQSQEQIAIASGHAQRQDGVMRVDNQLSKPAQ